MTRRIEPVLFTAALACAAAVFLVQAWDLESRGRLGPIWLAALMLSLTLFQLWRDLSAPAQQVQAASPDGKAGLAWALALLPAIYLLGCFGAVVLHTMLLVRRRSGRSWSFAVVYGALVGAPIYLLSRWMLRPELLTGALWDVFL